MFRSRPRFVQGNKPPHGTPINWRSSITQGLLADYLLNEGHGNSARDNTGNGLDLFYDGTATNQISWIGAPPNVNGESIPRTFTPVPVFGGNPHRFIAPVSYPRLGQFTEAVTVEFWWWHDTDSVANPVPICHGPVNTRFLFVKSSATNLIWRINTATDCTDTGAFVGNPARRWTHFVGTYDRINLRLYRDGLERAVTANTAAIATSTGLFCIADAASAANWANGNIGLARVWDRALHPDEVMALFTDPYVIYEELRGGHRPGSGTISFRPRLPFEFLATDSLQELLPVESRGQVSPGMPIEWTKGIALFETLPEEWTLRRALNELLPLESAGSADLSLRWNVLQPLNAPLLLMWDVVAFAAVFTLQVRWNVVAALAGLPIRWDVLPDVFTPFGVDPTTGEAIPPHPAKPGGSFSEDVHRPIATTTKTP